ncbi:hydroxymethylbilane synthase [Ferruginibacter lapsinanis]|uniref:hydroxymethylbilane synthase n=1 Tax=Ferruginibacter lapsinanis TaxID=563172 RepID=UPI001E485EBD|nr:hydroxymethylbilane synthase [Ferruginibacter lapsinanis]UEG48981.1 hydroxymethylbilane synthase [Ferruginibacter lapsinanis]
MNKVIRIGTRESQLAVWQANLIKNLLKEKNIASELIYIKSEGDIDLITPLYEMGVQGVFTRSLDAALLNNRIDIAVHSMKDVPTQLPEGIIQSAVLPRASYKDILVYKDGWLKLNAEMEDASIPFTIATSSIRRKAQWLNRYPHHTIENLRGNVNTRLQKTNDSNWNGAIFAAAGLERINLRPKNSINLEWMLPAPAQGAIMVVCRKDDKLCFDACHDLNDSHTAICTKIERDFLRTLLGGCSTPISALAIIENDQIIFSGNICSVDGKYKVEVNKTFALTEADNAGTTAATEVLQNGGQAIVNAIKNV